MTGDALDTTIVRLVDRPDLTGAFWGLTDLWPAFMAADPVADLYFSRLDAYPDHVLLALGPRGEVLGRALGVPVALGADVRRPHLPANGWDGVIRWAWLDSAASAGLIGHVAPVRPSRKHLEPRVAMDEYAARTRDDGLPEDPWLRLHVRLGGRIVGVCPTSMTIPGTLAQWRAWSGAALATSGDAEVDGALVPLHVDLAQDHAVYVEPNVWVEHSVP